jgi:hypothetical protein
MAEFKSTVLYEEQRQSEEIERLRTDTEAELLNDIQEIFSTPEGERVFYWLMQRTGVFLEVFHGNSRDIWMKGRRSVGIELLELRDMADMRGIRKLEVQGIRNILRMKKNNQS